jgi:DNA helicase-2/ATP-dependent DNA helicase PcrA
MVPSLALGASKIHTHGGSVVMDEPHELLADLTPEQREAVTHFEGPLLILAGAGSGKTRVITRRVAWLLHQGVRPGNILAITFTNKAAGEMRQRVAALVPGCRVWISTFHSFGARLLRQYGDRIGLDRNFTIYDQADRARLTKVAVEDAGLDATRFTPETLAAAISKAKNQLLTPPRYAERARDFFATTVARVYPVYEKRLRDANAMDFDDLLLWPALALRHDPELRAELDARFRFVLIDEYQDTNQAQYAIARGLSVDNPNLCVVGDPDQSIYKFRGSDIRNILDFERDFPQARVLTLTRNYRSTPAILRAAGGLIAHNTQRKPKDLVAHNPDGPPVTVLTFDSGVAEAEGIARRVREAVDAGRRSYRDFAVFIRINALSRGLEQAFVQHRVPYQIVKGLAFFERKENRDVLAYLRLLVNPRDDLSFLRAVNEPARGIGKVSLDHLRAYAEPREMSLLEAAAAGNIPAIKGRANAALREFAAMMAELRKAAEAAPDEVIRQVLDRSGYRRVLLDSHDPDDQERLANIEELITAAHQFAQQDGGATVADFLENITLASDMDGWDSRQDCVSVMTMHAAKGLEFPVVFMAAVEQNILPHERSIGRDDEVEEERRLAFVGMTRAKEELFLCRARMREFRGTTNYTVPSMFLGELSPEVQEVEVPGSGGQAAFEEWRTGPAAAEEGWTAAGMRRRPRPIEPAPGEAGGGLAEGVSVRHAVYGLGRVLSVSGYGATRRVKVRFRTAGEKTLILSKAPLEVVPES